MARLPGSRGTQGGRVCPGTSVQLQLAHVLLDPVLLGVGADLAALLGDEPVGAERSAFGGRAMRGEFGHAERHAHHAHRARHSHRVNSGGAGPA